MPFLHALNLSSTSSEMSGDLDRDDLALNLNVLVSAFSASSSSGSSHSPTLPRSPASFDEDLKLKLDSQQDLSENLKSLKDWILGEHEFEQTDRSRRTFLYKSAFSTQDLVDAPLFARFLWGYRKSEADNLLHHNTLRSSHKINWELFDTKFAVIDDINEPHFRPFHNTQTVSAHDITKVNAESFRKAIAAFARSAWEFEVLKKHIRMELERVKKIKTL